MAEKFLKYRFLGFTVKDFDLVSQRITVKKLPSDSHGSHVWHTYFMKQFEDDTRSI